LPKPRGPTAGRLRLFPPLPPEPASHTITLPRSCGLVLVGPRRRADARVSGDSHVRCRVFSDAGRLLGAEPPLGLLLVPVESAGAAVAAAAAVAPLSPPHGPPATATWLHVPPCIIAAMWSRPAYPVSMRRRARHRPEGQGIARTCLEYDRPTSAECSEGCTSSNHQSNIIK